MRRAEALTLLGAYAPGLRPGRSPADTLLAEIERRGDVFALDNVTGDWLILEGSREGPVLHRLA